MSKQELIDSVPSKRIDPLDGMAVTAEVWEDAHAYHRRQLQSHIMWGHGPGIVNGLEVKTNDSHEPQVCVQPGVAVDHRGRMIVLREPRYYTIDGQYEHPRLVIRFGESEPSQLAYEGNSPRTRQAEPVLEIRPCRGDEGEPAVELARIPCLDASVPLADVSDPSQCPTGNEIDQRFRRLVSVMPVETASVAVSYLGQGPSETHGLGAQNLARTLRQFGPCRAWVDDGVSLMSDLGDYDLIYLVSCGAFELDQDQMQALYEYLESGGTVFIENCWRSQGAPETESGIGPYLDALGFQLGELEKPNRLLSEPYLFSAPPPGYENETEGGSKIAIGGRGQYPAVIYSRVDYGCLWQGERRAGPASRADIRAALEWGANIVDYALHRRRQASR